VLVTIIFELVFSQPDTNNRFFFSDAKRQSPTVSLFKLLFFCMPSFTLSICYGSLVKVASTHLDQSVFSWVPGRAYTWADFGRDLTGKLADGTHYTSPSPATTVGIMGLDIVLYLGLTWYCDHVIGHNRGVSDPLYFPFTKQYWKGVF
jgi:hypothetical protein